MANSNILLISTAVTIAMNLSAQASAQEQNAGFGGIEEIIVTAQKRKENLQRVPIAVTALSGQALSEQRLFNVSDIGKATPNFSVGQQSPTQPTLTIRGVGSTDREGGSDRSVVPFVDEVYIGRTSASTFDVFDVERVEVLRGPQGTLFGRNVSGGAISIITAKPKSTFDAKAEVTGGNYGRIEARGMVNIPLAARWALRVSGGFQQKDGFYDNIFLQKNNVESTKSYNGRAQLAYDADTTRIIFSLDGSKTNTDGVANKMVSGELDVATFLAAYRSVFSTSAFPNVSPAARPFDVQNNIFGFSRPRSYRAYLRLEQDLGFTTLTLLPAYVRSDLRELRDAGGVPLRPAGNLSAGFQSGSDVDETYKSSSMEARLSSKNDQRLTWIAGLYYLNEKVDRSFGIDRLANNALSNTLFHQIGDYTSIAGFGQANWNPVDGVNITAGGRYTEDKKDYAVSVVDRLTATERAAATALFGRAPGITPATEIYSTSASAKFHAFTPRVAISYEPRPELMVYGSYARGFKSGGFDGTPPNAASVRPFAPERVNTFEIGVKSAFFDRAVRLNIAAFHNVFKDLQLRDGRLLRPDDQTSRVVIVTNAAEAVIKGVEGEFSWKVTNFLRVDLSGALLDTEVAKVNPGSSLIKGSELPRSPHYQFAASGRYLFAGEQTGAPFDAEVGIDYRRTGAINFEINEQAVARQSAYGLLDARLVLSRAGSPFKLTVWGKNLTDERYLSDATQAASGRVAIARYGDPRMYGVTFAWQLQ